MNERMIENLIYVFILAIILFQIIAALLPSLITAFACLSGTNLPLMTTLFATGGAMNYAVSGAVTLLVLRVVFKAFGFGGK